MVPSTFTSAVAVNCDWLLVIADAKFPGGAHLSEGGLGNVQAAVHESAWMAAMERNGGESSTT